MANLRAAAPSLAFGHSASLQQHFSGARKGRAQTLRLRLNANSSQIQTIGVPACADCRLTLCMTVTVQAHGFAEVLEFCCVQFNDDAFTSQGKGEVSCALTM
jgi:hypothetical protein